MLPTKPPVVDECWHGYDCHGQTLTWDYEEEGPSKCASTCTAQLPSVAVGQTTPPTVVAKPTPKSTSTTSGPALQTVNAAARGDGSWVAAALAAGVAVLV